MPYDKKWREANPEKWRAHLDRRREQWNAYMRQWRAEHPEQAVKHLRQAYYKRKHGLTAEQADALKAAGCSVCGTKREQFSARGDRLHIDHDHATGRFRGVLCIRCNTLLGVIEREPELIDKLFAYLAAA